MNHPPRSTRLVDVPSRGEAISAGAILTAVFALRLAYVFRKSFDSDESQHLHVAWAWTQGLVQYRDIVDNHTPLFHLLTAPIVWAIGERPDLLVWMRLTMIPVWLLSLWSLYRIGASLFSRRSALWATVLAALVPSAFFISLEFRADGLWAALWFLTLAALLGGRLRPGRALTAGSLLGATFAVSMKTTMLFAGLAAACLLILVVDPPSRAALRARRLWVSLGYFLLGAVILPTVLILFFATLHALSEFVDCALRHNLAVAAHWSDGVWRVSMFVVTLPALLYGARAMVKGSPSAGLGRRRALLFLSTALYCTAVNGFWPLITRQDFLPFYPLAVVSMLPWALESGPAGFRRRLAGPVVPSLIAAAAIGMIVWLEPPWKDQTRFGIALVTDVLRLTHADEPVMDGKGESLFRLRPVPYVLEDITLKRFRRGEIRDDIAERLIATKTYVSMNDSARLPRVGRGFLQLNYVPVGHLRVAGKLLASKGAVPFDFSVALPGRYTILSPAGRAAGVLDGSLFAEPRFLAAGRHRFEPGPDAQQAPLALVWARAAELGYSPFHPEGPR